MGGHFRGLSAALSESFGVLQAALLGVVGLILAFGLSLSLSRYEDRRSAIVTEANAIGTTHLRAETLPEPIRSSSLDLIETYTDSAVEISEYPPDTPEERAVTEREYLLQRELWALAGEALNAEPVATAPRLYVQSLNEMIDAQAARTAALNNQVPDAVFLLELVGASLALALLAAYLALVGRGLAGVLLAAMLVVLLLFVTADLDRPTRGPIEIPETVLTELQREMQKPPAAAAPR